jgi:transposase-like protein
VTVPVGVTAARLCLQSMYSALMPCTAEAPRDRHNPTRRTSSDRDLSLAEFMRVYPDDAACLDRLWRQRFAPDGHHAHCPRCERERKFHRTKTRASYTCDTCGLHIHPMQGTIFEKSTTSLRLWYYAMYLIASTRGGISAKQLEREIGVTYKTAHRMMRKIRTELMTGVAAAPPEAFGSHTLRRRDRGSEAIRSCAPASTPGEAV